MCRASLLHSTRPANARRASKPFLILWINIPSKDILCGLKTPNLTSHGLHTYSHYKASFKKVKVSMKVPIHPGSLYPYMVAMTYQMSQPWVNQALIGSRNPTHFWFSYFTHIIGPKSGRYDVKVQLTFDVNLQHFTLTFVFIHIVELSPLVKGYWTSIDSMGDACSWSQNNLYRFNGWCMHLKPLWLPPSKMPLVTWNKVGVPLTNPCQMAL